MFFKKNNAVQALLYAAYAYIGIHAEKIIIEKFYDNASSVSLKHSESLLQT